MRIELIQLCCLTLPIFGLLMLEGLIEGILYNYYFVCDKIYPGSLARHIATHFKLIRPNQDDISHLWLIPFMTGALSAIPYAGWIALSIPIGFLYYSLILYLRRLVRQAKNK